MKKIDTERWERRELYDFFSGMSQPFYSVTFQVDVTELYQYVKQKGLSFYHALVWLCTKAANRVENFRYTVREKEVWLLGERFPSFTDLKKGAGWQAVSMVLQSVSGRGILKAPDRLYGLEPGCQRSLFIHCRSH